MKKWIYITLMCVCAAAIILAAFMLGRNYFYQKKSEQVFSSLEDLIITEDISSKGSGSDGQSSGEPTLSPLQKYKKLYEKNADFVGWIRIDGTRINYPVVQRKNTLDYYLKRGFDEKYDFHGVPFIDERCNVLNADNIIIYSHNMKDGSMFAGLRDYEKKDFWASHKIIDFDTIYKYGKYEIVTVFKITAYTGFEIPITFGDDTSFNDFMNRIDKIKLYDTGKKAKRTDKLLTLYTCEYSRKDGRLIVLARSAED